MKRQADVGESQAIPVRPDSFAGTRIMAWTFLLGAFALFVVGVILLPPAIASALAKITVAADLRAEAIEGTVLLKGSNDLAWKLLREPIPVSPGSRITTDGRSRAFLELFDGSTVQLYNDSELLVERSQRGMFRDEARSFTFGLIKGRAVFGVAFTPDESLRAFALNVGGGRLELVEGSYLIETRPGGAVEVLVRRGKATLFNGPDIAEVGMGGRGGFTGDLPPRTESSSMSPLLIDSKLVKSQGSSPWRTFVVTEAGSDGQVHESAVESTTGDTPGMDLDFGYRFRRVSQREVINRHGEAGIAQIIDRDIRDYSTLQLRARAKVDYQSLSGGGSTGTEYPIMFKIFYVDSSGQDQIWYHGFYHQNDSGFSVAGASAVPRGEWFTYENKDLLNALVPAPVLIRRIEVLGSGWGFDAWVTEVSLEGR